MFYKSANVQVLNTLYLFHLNAGEKGEIHYLTAANCKLGYDFWGQILEVFTPKRMA